MSKFETKKKLLVAESEVYRQLLKLELQTFNVYAKRAKRRMTSASAYLQYVPYVMSGLPFLKRMFGKKRGKSRFSLKRMSSMLLMGWKTYQRFGPIFRGKFGGARQQPSKTAAEEYLAKRL